MKTIILICVSLALFIRVTFAQENTKITARIFEHKADSLIKIFKYDSASVYYCKAAKLFEQEQNWLLAVKNYRLTSNAFIRIAKYDSSLYYFGLLIDLVERHFKEYNRDDMFEKSDDYINLADIEEKKVKYNNQLSYCNKALELVLKTDSTAIIRIADILHKKSIAYLNMVKFDSAYILSQKALEFRIKALGNKHAEVGRSYTVIGKIYNGKGDYNNALDFFEKALQIYLPFYGEDHPEVANSYENIGSVFIDKGQYDKALDFNQKALMIRAKVFKVNHPDIANSYINIGTIYFYLADYKKALECFQKALNIWLLCYGENNTLVSYCYNNVGLIYQYTGKYDAAIEQYKKALKIRISVNGKNHISVAGCYNNIGLLYSNEGKYEKALDFYKKALQIWLSVYGESHPYIATTYINIGESYRKNGEPFKALQSYQKALLSNVPGFKDTSIFINPLPGKALSESLLLTTLADKAYTFYVLSKHSTDSICDMQASLSTYEMEFQLINNLRNGYNYENTELLLSESAKISFSQALHIALEYNKTDHSEKNEIRPFEFIEQGKGATMLARFNKLKAEHFAGILDSLLEVEKSICKSISLYTTQIKNLKYKKNGYDTLKVNFLETKRFSYSRKLDSLITYFEINYPSFYEFKYSNKIVSKPELQKAIDEHTAILNYFVGDSSLFIATITDSLYKINEIPIDSSFNKLVISYYKSIKTGETESFVNNSRCIYEKLIEPVKGYISGKEHLVVIPDDYLYYLPFETLIDNATSSGIANEDYSKLNYLIKSHSISYHHSATLWYNSKKREIELAANRKMNFAGFAPVFSKEKGNGLILSSNINAMDTAGNNLAYRSISTDMKSFNPLPYSKEEVTSIVRLFEKHRKEARGYLYSAASESNFKHNSSNYSIVHISSHGFANDKEPDLSGIAFSQPKDTSSKEDGILYAGETYSLNLNADLIVLSSCESGMGKLIKGEGLQAISRGFLYAGASNIIFSIWKALDKPTKDLMTQFYSNILDEKTYSESLRQAKLCLIKNPKTAFPHFWGGFILVGN